MWPTQGPTASERRGRDLNPGLQDARVHALSQAAKGLAKGLDLYGTLL